MAGVGRSDLAVALLWLGLGGALLLLLEPELPVAELPPPRPTAEPPAPETQPEQAAAPLRVTLPPPPTPQAPPAPEPPLASPPTLESAAVPVPAPRVVSALKPTPPAPVPAPTPQPVTQVTPLQTTPKQIEQVAALAEVVEPSVAAQPKPLISAPTPAPTPATVTVGAKEAAQGRTLLRLLEHGAGPEIELAWPNGAAERDRLYLRLRECLGMEVAVMSPGGLLYRVTAEGAAPWTPNLDRYSGFLRSPSGRLALEEQRLLRRVAGAVPGGQAVRLFPRHVDALLLGGLQALIGGGYAQLQVIHGRYRLAGRQVLIEGIEADGRPYPGRIDLTPAATRGCRHGLT